MQRIKLSLVGLGLSLVAVSNADVTIGGNRSFGMGGAGLALPVDVNNNYRLNPAFLAFGSKSPSLMWPQFGYRLDGIGPSDISNLVGDVSTGGLESDKIIDIARKYSDSNKTVAAGVDFGVRFAGFAVSAKGEVGLNTVPNQQLKNWAASGGNLSNVDAGSRLDAYGYGYQRLDIGYGNSLRSGAGRFAIGANVKKVKSYYAHKFADKDTIQSGNAGGVQNGSGIANDFAEGESIGMDLGVLYSPPNMDNTYVGVVVENFIEPGIVFPFQAPGGGGLIIQNGFDPNVRTYSVGIGHVQDKLLLAADMVDIGNRAGRAETRYGAELTLTKGFAVRAGYNSRTAFSFGLSLGGFNIQVAGNAPITLGTVIRF